MVDACFNSSEQEEYYDMEGRGRGDDGEGRKREEERMGLGVVVCGEGVVVGSEVYDASWGSAPSSGDGSGQIGRAHV